LTLLGPLGFFKFPEGVCHETFKFRDAFLQLRNLSVLAPKRFQFAVPWIGRFPRRHVLQARDRPSGDSTRAGRKRLELRYQEPTRGACKRIESEHLRWAGKNALVSTNLGGHIR